MSLVNLIRCGFKVSLKIFLALQVKYHAEFEKAKGKFTQVADDPETLRIKQNSKIIRLLLNNFEIVFFFCLTHCVSL